MENNEWSERSQNRQEDVSFHDMVFGGVDTDFSQYDNLDTGVFDIESGFSDDRNYSNQLYQEQPDNGLIDYEKDEVTGVFDFFGDVLGGVVDVDRGNIPLAGGVAVAKNLYDIMKIVDKKNQGQEISEDEKVLLTDYINTENRRKNTSWAGDLGRGINEFVTLGGELAISSALLGSTASVAIGGKASKATAKKLLKRKLKNSIFKVIGNGKASKLVANTFVKGTSLGINTFVGGSLKLTGEVVEANTERRLIKALNGDDVEVADSFMLEFANSFSNKNKFLSQDIVNTYTSVAVEKGFGAMGVFNSKLLKPLKKKVFNKLVVVTGMEKLLSGKLGKLLTGKTPEKMKEFMTAIGRHEISEELFEERDEAFIKAMYKSYDETGDLNVTKAFIESWNQTTDQWKTEIGLNLIIGGLISTANLATQNSKNSAIT